MLPALVAVRDVVRPLRSCFPLSAAPLSAAPLSATPPLCLHIDVTVIHCIFPIRSPIIRAACKLWIHHESTQRAMAVACCQWAAWRACCGLLLHEARSPSGVCSINAVPLSTRCCWGHTVASRRPVKHCRSHGHRCTHHARGAGAAGGPQGAAAGRGAHNCKVPDETRALQLQQETHSSRGAEVFGSGACGRGE